jgi:hypothetical protein
MSQVVKGLLGSFSTARRFEKTEPSEKLSRVRHTCATGIRAISLPGSSIIAIVYLFYLPSAATSRATRVP